MDKDNNPFCDLPGVFFYFLGGDRLNWAMRALETRSNLRRHATGP
jgi:hypothetical protein